MLEYDSQLAECRISLHSVVIANARDSRLHLVERP